MSAPYVIVVSAFPGCGKTVTSNFLGRSLGLDVISTSSVRQDFGWACPGTMHSDSSQDQVESALQQQSGLAYAVLELTLRARLSQGRAAIVEGTFNTLGHRQMLYDLASEGVAEELVFVRCACSRDQAIQRMAHRKVLRDHGFDPGREILDMPIHDRYRTSYEPIPQDPQADARGVSIVVYRTDSQEMRALTGCVPGSRGAVVHELLGALADGIRQARAR